MLFVNLLGLLLIGLIVWWFWLYKPAATSSKDDAVTIVVDNGVYTPARIKIPAHKPFAMNFERKDASPCAAMVVFADLEISADLAVDKVTKVDLPPLEAGEYPFTCQMQMYKGMLVVE